MNPGKEICKELKELRKQIAEENGTLPIHDKQQGL